MTEHTVSDGSSADHDPRSGKFLPGNRASVGKSQATARRVARLRAEFLRSVTPEDVREVVEALVREAKTGNVQAMREFFSRALGPAEAVDLMQRLDTLEQALTRATSARKRT